MMLLSTCAYAVKAKPGIIDFRQPDGSIVKILLHGNKEFHYATTPDDILLLPNQDGFYEYAVEDAAGSPKLSGVKAINPPASVKQRMITGALYEKSMAKEGNYRYSTAAFPTTGSPHALVVLVEYQDVKFKVSDPVGHFDQLLNGENYTLNGATGSCGQYFSDNSSGKFKPTFDVYGPVLLKNDRKYYGGGGYDEPNACQMVVEAVKALDSEVDFSQYDHNDDGFVDNIYVFYADMGEADGGPKESVWPYSWELVMEGVTLKADGVQFNTYAVSNELQSDGQPDGIGTFVHEFGHVLGLPDLYNTESTSDYTTPSYWSVMDCGNYNNDSRTPAAMSAFERYSLGWLTPEEIMYSGNYTLENMTDCNRAYLMTTHDSADEFYILETRKRKGWDAYLPGEGLLFWHINFIQKYWDYNEVNNDRNRPLVKLVRADNKATNNTLSADPFPGSDNVTEFSATTEPALLSHAGKPLNVTSIGDISEGDNHVSFYATLSKEGYDAGIDIPEIEGEQPVYDLAGRRVGTAVSGRPLNLEKGIYITGGKKIVIR